MYTFILKITNTFIDTLGKKIETENETDHRIQYSKEFITFTILYFFWNNTGQAKVCFKWLLDYLGLVAICGNCIVLNASDPSAKL